jgi:hypothetical protein
MEHHETEPLAHGLRVIDELMASSVQLPSQTPRQSTWSAEKRLAAAVLGTTLLELRERHDDPSRRRRIAESLEWIHSDEVEWPFSFLRLCDVFELDAEWVRGVVARWQQVSTKRRERMRPRYRQAA